MKRKAIVLLIASMVLTFSSVGTVFAEETSTQTAESAIHEHTWGSPYYVVDKEAEYEWVTVVDTPEHTVYGAQLYTEQPDGTWLGNGEIYWFENGFTIEDFQEILKDMIKNEGYIGNYVNVEKTVPAVTHEEYQEVSPEEGHNEYKCTVCGEIQNSDTGEVIKPGTLPEEPTNPSEPTTPSESDNPSEVTNPTGTENTDYNTQDTENNGQDSDNATQAVDNTEQDNTETSESKAPQTGDTASLISLATLAGSVVTGGTAISLRRKFKK